MACALGALLVSASILVAQTDRADFARTMQSAVSRCAITQCILNAQVVNVPFSAEVTTMWQPPASSGQASLRTTARYYRDSAGRVRVEQSFVGSNGRSGQIILAPEGDSRNAFVLDPVARTVSTPVPRGLVQMMVGDGGYDQFALPRSMRRFIGFFVVPDDGETSEELGQTSMAGVQVTGTRFVTRLPGLLGNGRAERWVSPELGLVVYSRSEDAHFGILEYQLTNISRSDPPAELFEVPQEYRETPFEFPLTWNGPYAPKAGSK
jgi:hypothetical protein